MTPREELDFLKKKKKLKELEARALNTPQQEQPDTAVPRQQEQSDYGFGDEVKNAVTFGLSDKASNAGEWLAGQVTGNETPYADIASKRREAKSRYRDESPWLSTGASMAGGMANPLANIIQKYTTGAKIAGPGINKAMPRYLSPPGVMESIKGLGRGGLTKGLVRSPADKVIENMAMKEMMGRGAVVGTGIAGGQALGENIGEGLSPSELATRVSTGSGTGTVLGGSMPPLVKGGAFALKQLANGLSKIPGAISVGGRAPGGGGMQTTLGWRKIAEALERDEYTSIDEAVKRLDELGPEGSIADLGENTRALAYSVYSKPGKGSGKVRDFVEDRHKGTFSDDPAGTLEGGQSGRIGDKLDELFPEGYAGKKNQKEVNKLYDKAYSENQDLFSDELNDLVRTRSGKKALKEAVGLMSDDMERVGKPDPKLTAMWNEVEGGATPGGQGISKGLKLKTWNYVKTALDEMVEHETKHGTEGSVRRVDNIRKRLVKELDNLTAGDEYAGARGLSSDDFANRDAYAFGQKFMRQDVKLIDLQNKLADMTEEQLHNYRIGAVKVAREKVTDNPRAGVDHAQALLDNRNLQKKLKIVFGDNKKFGEYMTLAKNEAEMSKLRKTLGGSQTDKKMASREDSGLDTNAILSGVAKFKMQNYLGGAKDIYSGVKNKLFMREATSDLLADALTGRDLTGINTKYQAQELSKKVQQILSDLALRNSVYSQDYRDPRLSIKLKEIK